ncbi:stage II sporulation protein M [Nocardiopsis changdeensis]|uniref:Stage II sporulation protein M n=1 Tax=Nocardiopsis changdeensis TaxID=2831969 RepID=A0ABX8BRP8_9ACTN|nr:MULTISPECIES: stage II sporulation protein M [Nocardiopsis]QUX24796.1 stage II sporulation protein M [Nocardiopsis changdeensis]QYX35182.1 stage II sporulation protein M [Nocardiopsis sp. MT53]
MRHLREPFRIIRANLGAYLAMNAVMFGLFFAGVAAALAFPDLHAAQITSMEQDGTADLVGELLGNVWLFGLTILAVNVLTVAVATILLPSMIVPFAGIVLFAYRAFGFGLSLAPVDATAAKILIPHSLTILIEFQAYVLVMLGAYLLGRAWLRPASVGADTRRQGYLRGLGQLGRLLPPALALFVIGAAYEAFEIIYLVPPLLLG